MHQVIQPTLNYTTVPVLSERQRKERDDARRRGVQRELVESTRSLRGGNREKRPACYERPAYGTPQYWRDCGRGWISDQQQRDDHADFEVRRRRALDSKHNKAPAPHRHLRGAPRASKQFAKPMATQAARDDRLTPQSKALLQVIVARTGRGRVTDTTKTTLGRIMNRCPRSIQRYVRELVKFGYIRTQTIKSRRTRFYVGLRIWIMNSVLPFWAQQNGNYDPEKWPSWASIRRKSEETKESLTNDSFIIKNLLSADKPHWFDEIAHR